MGDPGLGQAPGPRTGVSAAGSWLTALSLSTVAGCRAEGGEKRKPEAEVSSSAVGTCACPRGQPGGGAGHVCTSGAVLWGDHPGRGPRTPRAKPDGGVPLRSLMRLHRGFQLRRESRPHFFPSVTGFRFLFERAVPPTGGRLVHSGGKAVFAQKILLERGTVTTTFQNGAFSGRVIGGDPFVCLSGEVAQPKAVWRFGSS